jgi:hypothetical protein
MKIKKLSLLICLMLIISVCGTHAMADSNVNQEDSLLYGSNGLNNATKIIHTELSKTSMEKINDFLSNIGVPKNKLDSMDGDLKRLIYDTNYRESKTKKIKYIEMTDEKTIPSQSRTGYQISSSDLRLSCVAIKYGSDQVKFYPSYEWLTKTQPKGKDFFGYITTSSFSTVANAKSNLVYSRAQSYHNWTIEGSLTYTGSCFQGYEHKGSSLGTPGFPIYIKAHCYYMVDIDVTNPIRKIILSYVHDTSSGGAYNYSIYFSGFGFSFTPTSSNVGYMQKQFDFDSNWN